MAETAKPDQPQPNHWHDGQEHKVPGRTVVTGGSDPDQAPPGSAQAVLTVPAPPGVSGELAIDAAQVGGSSRGGEWNTAPHPGSPTSDRLTAKPASDKPHKGKDEEGGHGREAEEAKPARAAGRKPGR